MHWGGGGGGGGGALCNQLRRTPWLHGHAMATIQSAADLFAFCEMRLQQPSATDSTHPCVHTRREFVLVSSEDFSALVSSSSLRTVPGTRAMHSIRPDEKGISEPGVFLFRCKTGDRGRCTNRDHVSEWRPHTIRRIHRWP